MINKPYCIWMIGISGSGKSTIAEIYQKKYDAKIMSSDAIREELYGDENIQGNANEVFKTLHNRCCDLLKNGFSIIYDCTNIKRKDRKKFFDYCNEHNIKAIHHAIVICTPYSICLENNKKRSRHVPEEVIKKQMYSFNIPFFEEGFNYITMYRWGDFFEDISPNSDIHLINWDKNNYNAILELMKGFDQKNKHHKYDLYEHSERVYQKLKNCSNNKALLTAGMIHDIGKLYTQTIDDKGQAHYYNHAEVGTYSLLTNLDSLNLNESEVLKCLFYINYHMLPFSWENENTKEKYKKIFGEKNYDDLCLFNYADKEACK